MALKASGKKNHHLSGSAKNTATLPKESWEGTVEFPCCVCMLSVQHLGFWGKVFERVAERGEATLAMSSWGWRARKLSEGKLLVSCPVSFLGVCCFRMVTFFVFFLGGSQRGTLFVCLVVFLGGGFLQRKTRPFELSGKQIILTVALCDLLSSLNRQLQVVQNRRKGTAPDRRREERPKARVACGGSRDPLNKCGCGSKFNH